MDSLVLAEKAKFRYAQLADHLARQIREGVWQPGEQLPSVRQMSQRQGLSIGTVSQSYYLLADLDLVEVRPQSGYYVRASHYARTSCQPVNPLPRLTTPGVQPQSALTDQIADLISRVYGQLNGSAAVQFSVTGITASLFPTVQLGRALQKAVRELPHGGIAYAGVQGDALLRRQVARHALHWSGLHLTEQDLVTAEGCSTAMAYCLRAVTRPGDTVAIESPAYFAVLHLAVSLGLRVLELPTSPTTGVELPALEAQLAKGRVQVCLFTPSFSNPMGSLMPEAHKEALVRLLDRYDVPLIEDDVYGETYFGKERPRPCKAFDREGRVLWCSSVSKTLAPGYRVGWVAPGRYLEQVKRAKFHHSVASPSVTQHAVGLFMATGHYGLYMTRLRKFLFENYLCYQQAMAAYFPASVRISQPQGGFMLWVELDERLDTYRLYEEAIERRISIAPGQMYTLHQRYAHCFKLSFGIPFTQEVDDSLRILGELLAALYQEIE